MGAYLSKEANFAVVGCGEAGKAAGWFHGYQLVAGGVEGARLSDVVEPFLLSEEGRATPAGAAFQELVGRWAGTAVDFHREIPRTSSSRTRTRRWAASWASSPPPKSRSWRRLRWRRRPSPRHH